jgi:hypothetical protein
MLEEELCAIFEGQLNIILQYADHQQLLDALRGAKILQEREDDKINKHATDVDKTRTLLQVLKRRGKCAQLAFVLAICFLQPELHAMLCRLISRQNPSYTLLKG